MSRKHGFFRPHLGRGFPQVASTTLREGVGGSIITSIFADGTDGFYFDFSKTDRLFQNLTGTPADGAGEAVHLALDSHSWQGRTFAQEIASRTPALLDDFSTYADTAAMLAAGWAGSNGGAPTLVSAQMKLTNGLAAFGRVSRPFTTVAGRTYKASARNDSPSAGTLSAATASNLSGSLGSVSIAAGATGEITFVASGTTTYVGFQSSSSVLNYEALYDDFRVDEIPGNHGLQATAAAQPKWQTGGLARFDGSDDNLLTTLVASNTGMTLLAKAKLAATGGNRAVMGVNGADGVSRCFLAFNVSGYAAGGVGSDSLSVIKGSVDRSGAYCVLGLTVDTSNWRLYEQGVQTNTGAKNGSCNTTLGIPLGGLNANGTFGTFANIDLTHALAIKKVLTAAEIAAITNLWGTS